MQNHQIKAMFGNLGATLTSKAETGGFSPASSKDSSISAMEPARIQQIKQSVIPIEKGFIDNNSI